MSTEQKDTEQNALAARLNRFVENFKKGKVISYKLMAVLLILVAVIGSTWYITSERRKANSQRWVDLEEANSISSLQEISKNNPSTIYDRLARLQIARSLLSVGGIDQLSSFAPEQRKKAIENIEQARESYGKLLDEFKDDPVFKAECLLALAKSEAALVPVPAKEGQLTEFKGSITKVVEFLDQLSEVAAPGSPWAIYSKKLADDLRHADSASAHEFITVEQVLYTPVLGDQSLNPGGVPTPPGFPGSFGGLPKGSDFPIPGVPSSPLSPGGSPKGSGEAKLPSLPPGPVVGPQKGSEGTPPPGPIIPPVPPGTPPQGTESTPPKDVPAPVAPPPKTPNASPMNPDPKAPNTPPAPTPKAPDPKAPGVPGPTTEKK